MSGFNCSLHFMTLKQIGYEESNVAVTSYHDRTHIEANNKSMYTTFTEEFHLQQGRKFILHNRLATIPNKISKFKDQIKELDDLFATINNQTDLKSTANNLNIFLSCYSSSIAKVVWLTSNHLLLVMKNAILIWLIIDVLSGDLIKISIDKSLKLPIHLATSQTTSSSTSSTKHTDLSGQSVCDAALLVRSLKRSSTMLVLAYSDVSIVDVISFGKSSNINEYLKDSKSHTLKKLKEFDPFINTYEFALPHQYLIDKRISYTDSFINETNSTFTVWWENSGYAHKAIKLNEPKKDSKSTSLLDRDDLRNNVLILSTDLSCSNLLEYLFKSDGNLLFVCYMSKTSLIAIEQTELNQNKYLLGIYRYDLPNESNNASETKSSLKIKLNSLDLKSKIISNNQIRVSKSYIIMLTADQTLILYEITRSYFKTFNLASVSNTDNQKLCSYNAIEWLIKDLVFAVYNINGDMCVFDIAFNQLNLQYMTRAFIEFRSISHYLNPNLFAPYDPKNIHEKNNSSQNMFQRLIASPFVCFDCLWSFFYYKEGPMGLIRINFSENFNCVSLTNHYLKNSINLQDNGLEKAVKLLGELDWDCQRDLTLNCLSKIINFILCDQVVFDLKTENLGKRALKFFYAPRKNLNEKTIYEKKRNVSHLARRFFIKILKNLSFHSAYLLAVDIGAKDLLNDLYYCALEHNENQIAELSRLKYHEYSDKEEKNKALDEQNKSANEITIISMNEEKNADSDSDIEETTGSSEDLTVSYQNLKRIQPIQSIGLTKIYTQDEIDEYATNLINKYQIIND